MNKAIRIIVAGSRTFNDYELLKKKLDFYLQNKNVNDIEILEGEAKGADKLGKQYAIEKGIKYTGYPADWNKYGKGAGFKRNREMAQNATHAVIFWDGESKGTKNMIDLCDEYRLVKRIVLFNNNQEKESDRNTQDRESNLIDQKESKEAKDNNPNVDLLPVNPNTIDPNLLLIKVRCVVSNKGKSYDWKININDNVYQSDRMSHHTFLVINLTKNLNEIIDLNYESITRIIIKEYGEWEPESLIQVKDLIFASLPEKFVS